MQEENYIKNDQQSNEAQPESTDDTKLNKNNSPLEKLVDEVNDDVSEEESDEETNYQYTISAKTDTKKIKGDLFATGNYSVKILTFFYIYTTFEYLCSLKFR